MHSALHLITSGQYSNAADYMAFAEPHYRATRGGFGIGGDIAGGPLQLQLRQTVPRFSAAKVQASLRAARHLQ